MTQYRRTFSLYLILWLVLVLLPAGYAVLTVGANDALDRALDRILPDFMRPQALKIAGEEQTIDIPRGAQPNYSGSYGGVVSIPSAAGRANQSVVPPPPVPMRPEVP